MYIIQVIIVCWILITQVTEERYNKYNWPIKTKKAVVNNFIPFYFVVLGYNGLKKLWETFDD